MVDYNEFKQKIDAYNNYGFPEGDKLYFETISKKEVWNNLNKVTEKEAEIMLTFLNKWKCRIPNTSETILQIKAALVNNNKIFEGLKDKKLKDIDFDAEIKVDMRIDKLKEIIIELFDSISNRNVGKRTLGATATSKMMHIINPELFVMWDDSIRFNYGFAENGQGYFKFLKDMQELRKELLKDYSKVSNVDIGKAEESICKQCHNDDRVFEKIIDEFNYTKFTLKL